MLAGLTLVVMLIVAYASAREGFLTSLTTLVNVVVSGVVAFNFFEPLAGEFEALFRGSVLAGFEDSLSLFAIFAACLGVLRVTTHNLAKTELDLPALAQQVGAAVIALLTGYVLAGILVVFLQMLPWGERFLDFEPTADPNNGIRKLVPPDRAWLAAMNRLGAGPMSQADSVTFDPDATFTLRYTKFRRFKEQP